MSSDPSSASLTARLSAALDRLEVALEAAQGRLADVDATAAVLQAMTEDRAALAAKLDEARSRAAALEAAASAADDKVAVAAKAVREALTLDPRAPETAPRLGDGVAGD